MSEPQKRTILTRFWVGDTVYSVADAAKGLVMSVSVHTYYFIPRYFVVFDDRKGEWCEEMELSAEKVFTDMPESGAAKA